jgi:hypothetical protein
MQTECSADLFGFARVEGRAVVAGFDGDRMISDAGAMLLGPPTGRSDWSSGLPAASRDHRAAELVEHTVASLVSSGWWGLRWATRT